MNTCFSKPQRRVLPVLRGTVLGTSISACLAVVSQATRRRILAGSIAAFVATAVTASAADQTWLNAGPTNNWNLTDQNWDGNLAWTQSNSAIFGGLGETVTLTTGIT